MTPNAPDAADDGLPHALLWPEGLDAARFLAEIWQRRPLLLPGALPGFDSPLPPDELAGLALEPDTTPRLLLEDGGGDFRIEHGPFDEARLAGLDGRFSLLVTDVEKHLPELRAWIRPFGLVPSWRLDDLMVSYAPDGGSVGAHVDAYDVFLLQASGGRRWSIDASVGGAAGGSARTARRGDLELVEPFRPTDTWELGPGDVLYLPPGVPHHGVAIGEGCTTWSIGFRAPSTAEIVAGVAALLVDDLDARPLPDPPLAPGPAGELGAASLGALRRAWDAAVALDEATFARLVGRVLTTHRFERDPDGGPDEGPGGGPDGTRTPPDRELERWSFSRLAWSATGPDGTPTDADPVTLFADGEAIGCTRGFARRACDPDATLPTGPGLAPGDAHALERLVEIGAVRRRDG